MLIWKIIDSARSQDKSFIAKLAEEGLDIPLVDLVAHNMGDASVLLAPQEVFWSSAFQENHVGYIDLATRVSRVRRCHHHFHQPIE